jgi:REP element-mobilizing transposase RayT/DNA-binding response OmpR family regulator
MTANILLVTPHFGFGQLLKVRINGLGDFRVTLSSGMASSLSLSSRGIFNLVILDSACNDGSIARISTELRKFNPGIRQLVILHKGQKAPVGIGNIDVDEWLLLPFTVNALFEAIQRSLSDNKQLESAKVKSTGQSTPSNNKLNKHRKDIRFGENADFQIRWVLTNTSVEALLEEHMNESGAQAGLIIKDGVLWAYAGQFLQEVAEKIAQKVIGYWGDRSTNGMVDSKSNDLIRYIQVENYPSESLLYATSLRTNMVIAIIFAGDTQFFEIRSHVKHLVDVLIEENQVLFPLDNGLRPGTSHRSSAKKVESDEFEGKGHPTEYSVWGTDREFSNQDLFDDDQHRQETFGQTGELIGDQDGGQAQVDGTIPLEVKKTVLGGARRGFHTSLLANFTQLSTMDWHILNYACLLIPRMPRHKIVGNVRVRLEYWIRDIAIASGWRLDYLTIRPEYLHWIASAPPNITPLTIIRQVESYTSKLLFQEFPQFALENPSQHFWAPGYVLASEFDPFTPAVIEGFTKHTRHAQGIVGEI